MVWPYGRLFYQSLAATTLTLVGGDWLWFDAFQCPRHLISVYFCFFHPDDDGRFDVGHITNFGFHSGPE